MFKLLGAGQAVGETPPHTPRPGRSGRGSRVARSPADRVEEGFSVTFCMMMGSFPGRAPSQDLRSALRASLQSRLGNTSRTGHPDLTQKLGQNPG
jgi:hypothetical protein